jgi:peptide/nickel transport system substrate-binding protein
MDAWVVRFRLQENLHWSDGEPLTAADAVFAYELARTLLPTNQHALLERTADFRLVDDLTVEWRGVIGYQSPDSTAQIFWPLPEHAWGEIAPVDLPSAAIASQNPPGYGPFTVLGWEGTQGLVLGRNPQYFRASEGMPGVDLLRILFVEPGQPALDLLLNGGCDVLDSSTTRESMLADYASSAGRGEIQIARQPASLEMIFFNTEPYDIYQARLLGLKEVRQAMVHCFDNRGLAESVLSGLAFPALSYLVPQHPDLEPTLAPLAYDLAAGELLLQRAGWLDFDLNPATPRTAKNVPGVPDGTRLALTYLVSGEADRLLVAEQFQRSMGACGIGVEISVATSAEYLAPGPDGPVFGRKFQVAGFAWAAADGQVPCTLFTSAQIPAPYPKSALDWGGANASAYRSTVFDQACWQAIFNEETNPRRKPSAALAQQTYLGDAPALPLYWRPRLALAVVDVCGLPEMVLSGGLLAAPERLYRSNSCPEP